MSICVFPGSFDPVTGGHLNLIERASAIFEKVMVVVMVNRAKQGAIPYEERVHLIRRACESVPNTDAELWTGLLADYMREHPGSILIRGVRNASEYDSEMLAAEMNRRLYPGLETIFLPVSPEWTGVSSSAVREIASFGGDIRPYVPEVICEDIQKWLIPAKQKG